MRTVCYVVNMMTQVQTPEGEARGPICEQHIHFGPEDEVYKDLLENEKTFQQAMITHTLDPIPLAVARCKLQITRQLLTHDMDAVPTYPAVGDGKVVMKDRDAPVTFSVQVRVSKRGEQTLDQKLALVDRKKPINILIPPGARV